MFVELLAAAVLELASLISPSSTSLRIFNSSELLKPDKDSSSSWSSFLEFVRGSDCVLLCILELLILETLDNLPEFSANGFTAKLLKSSWFSNSSSSEISSMPPPGPPPPPCPSSPPTSSPTGSAFSWVGAVGIGTKSFKAEAAA